MKGWLYLTVLLLTAADIAGAQTMLTPRDSVPISTTRWGFGAQGGYFRSSGADEGAYYFGGVFRYRIGSMLSLEGTLGYRGRQAFNFGTVSGSQLYADISTVPITASAMVFF